ncbi:glucosaminidase domain-containing protein [Clostridiaceae bacterium UIB06]|uniref:Glucosaminidase domain-containing protein n=1 Tax=Clostridium thailandense TaxID=2794346 RepID=A0A949TVM8_9CLOT|nr:N-acetylglucosaminidase [Clostridium thailandense]MBV7272701.1 glucosaminidase domain-containing protein [Clostridium thailandense]MCH5135867.1 glucosaminidase domain-containing protein [Clostridiaceae bacterium UIB06]
MGKNIKSFLFILIFILGIVQFKASAAESYLDKVPKTDISTSKEWIIKFNNNLDSTTINNKNITVTDENEKSVPVSISLGSNPNLVVVSPIVAGYDPGAKYNLIISSDVKSSSGQKLANTVKLQFTTSNRYIDCTSYEDLPEIDSMKFEYTPLLSNQKQGFFINAKNTDEVQYRVFVHSYTDDKSVYEELTDGYTTLNNGKITALKTLTADTNGTKYKVIIYAKRKNVQGAHKDSNTDYDNYYTDYMRCINQVDTDNSTNTTFTRYDVSIDEMTNTQANLTDKAVFVETNKFDNAASKNQIEYYVNPNNFLDNYGKYQFLKLSYTDGITADNLNNILQGKGILEGKGQVFLDAAKSNNINVAYLVAHALLESGNGTSVLANGGAKDSNGNYIYGVPVYNFFGIGAVDSDAIGGGTKTAYDNKWFTPDDGIKGGANWIAASYINNAKYKQDTIYKMRWNPEKPGEHQYATDISWAFKQIPKTIDCMKLVYDQVQNVTLNFDIPKFK